MSKWTLLLAILTYAVLLPPASAKEPKRPLVSAKIMQAKSIYIDCECPRALAVARNRALQQFQGWGRFQIVQGPREADLVFLFSANEYLGDYLTRDGPDKRPVAIESTIMTVIDANNGEKLWSDSRRWGSWLVDRATKDLIEELRDQMAAQVKTWTLNDILTCSVTPIYRDFAQLTPEEALAKSEPAVSRIAGKPDRLNLSSPIAPDFCKRAELVIGSDDKIVGFEVVASQAEDLNISEVLQEGDRFDFTGGKYANGDKVYFSALSKDKKIHIEFDVQDHRSVLSKVSYFY